MKVAHMFPTFKLAHMFPTFKLAHMIRTFSVDKVAHMFPTLKSQSRFHRKSQSSFTHKVAHMFPTTREVIPRSFSEKAIPSRTAKTFFPKSKSSNRLLRRLFGRPPEKEKF